MLAVALYSLFFLAVPKLNLKTNADRPGTIVALSREKNSFDEVYIIVLLNADSRQPSDILLSDVRLMTCLNR